MSNLLCPLTDWRPICFAQWPISDENYRIVLLNGELPNVPPNSYGTLAKRKRKKVYYCSPSENGNRASLFVVKWGKI